MGFLTKDAPEPEIAEPYLGQRWEYKTLNLNFKASIGFESAFNDLGQQGWEFVAMVSREAIGSNVHRAIFKRPL